MQVSFTPNVTYTTQDIINQMDKTSPHVIVFDLRHTYIRLIEVENLEREFGTVVEVQVRGSPVQFYIISSYKFMGGIQVCIIRNEKSAFFEPYLNQFFVNDSNYIDYSAELDRGVIHQEYPNALHVYYNKNDKRWKYVTNVKINDASEKLQVMEYFAIKNGLK